LAHLRHAYGGHTFVDVEDWTEEDGVTVVKIIGQVCWLCPARM